MKTKLLFAFLALVMISAGCRKVKQLANINVDIPYNQTINVPQGGYTEGFTLPGGGILLPFPAVSMATNSKQYMEQYKTAANKVISVDLKSLTLGIQTPPNRNFDFLDWVEVYISANGLPERLVAYDRSIPKGQNTLVFYTMTDVNLKDYYAQDTIYFRLSAHINAVPPAGETLLMSSVFHLLANPLE